MILFILGILFYLSSEYEEQARDNRFPVNWGKWWNSDTSWTNKHRWNPSWFFKTIGVPFTDAEHFFELLGTLSALAALYLSMGGWSAVVLFYLGTICGGIIKEIFLKNVQ